jgi:hypothetical protein
MFRKYGNYQNKSNNFSLSFKMYNLINSIKNKDTKANNINNQSVQSVQNVKNVMYPTFNVLIATIGRNTLEDLIESLREQLNENDCITIIFDNNKIRKINNIDSLKCKVVIINETTKLGYWGHGIRNKYASLLEKRDFILHADDDDTYFPGAFDKLRKLCINPNITYIAMIIKNKYSIPNPNLNKIVIGNISTQCGVIPYNYNSKSKWGDFYGGDVKFYIDLLKVSKIKFIKAYIYNYGNKKDNLIHLKNKMIKSKMIKNF